MPQIDEMKAKITHELFLARIKTVGKEVVETQKRLNTKLEQVKDVLNANKKQFRQRDKA